jgi:chemotaxis protein methyltransferase CheR
MLIKYFSNVKSRWVVRDELKRLVEFRQLNLVKPWTGLPLFDIIFLRNVLIYFDVETKRSILTNARRQLHPSGYLLLGGAETTMNLDANWVTVTRGNVTMYQQKPSLAAAA